MRSTRAASASVAAPQSAEEYTWRGEDEFTHLEDRKAEPPVPLPPIKVRKRIVLVRHGQSTWNAEGRIQGSTDFAVLTAKGQAQADTTREMLLEERFDKLFHSPLQRASQTAAIVWAGAARSGIPSTVLPALREVDLYSFQGLLKAEGQARFGAEFASWQRTPADFRIDASAPVVELWHRASLAWHEILLDDDVRACALVVAHNAVNQALICAALGLPPSFFRRLLQSNAASTVLDFIPPLDGGPPLVTVDRLNQSPDRQFIVDQPGAPRRARVLLLHHAATHSSEAEILPSSGDEPCSALGDVQAVKAGELLLDTRIDVLLVAPAERCVHTAAAVAKCQGIGGDRSPLLQVLDELANIDAGSFAGRPAADVQMQPLPPDAERAELFMERIGLAWDLAHAAAVGRGAGAGAATASGSGSDDEARAALPEDPGTVCIVADAAAHAALLCHCLGLGPEYLGRFRMSPAGVSVIEFPHDPDVGVVRCHNYTAHLGRWAVPIMRDTEEAAVCGIDGCF